MADYEKEENFSSLWRTTLGLLSVRGYGDVCDKIKNATISVKNTYYDSWNNGIYVYTVYIDMSINEYSKISAEEKGIIENIISSTLNEIVNNEEGTSFETSLTVTWKNSDIDWNLVGGLTGKKSLESDIYKLKSIMVNVATGKFKIQEKEAEYVPLNNDIKQKCKKLSIPYSIDFQSLWDWYNKWRKDFPHYQDRREYLDNLFKDTLDCFTDKDDSIVDRVPVIVNLEGWDKIEREVKKIYSNSAQASSEEDFQTVGLLCRDVIITLAQEVYNKELHGELSDDGKEIGKSDAVRMLERYIGYKLSGRDNKELRAFGKNSNDLANQLTHKRSADRKDMLLVVNATIALINFVGILEGK